MTNDESTSAPLKQCPACGQHFACCQGTGWCATVVLSDETRARLQTAYRDCLCPDCLRSHAVSPAR